MRYASDFSLMKHITYGILIVYSFSVMIKMWINNTIKISKLKKECKFLDGWLENKCYKLWLGKLKSTFNTFGKLCVKDIDLPAMGCRALDLKLDPHLPKKVF